MAFKNIISEVPQRSILGSILFNLSINNLFYIIGKALMFNFADDIFLSTYSKTIEGLLHIIQSNGSKKMIANAGKFLVILKESRITRTRQFK